MYIQYIFTSKKLFLFAICGARLPYIYIYIYLLINIVNKIRGHCGHAVTIYLAWIIYKSYYT